MERGRCKFGLGVGVLALAAAVPAMALGPVNVPNHSFELPVVNNPFNATAELSSWQKSPIVDYVEASGTFKNVDTAADPDTNPDIDNVDGVQGAFLFSAPFNEIYQPLAATYTVGEAYQLTVGIEGGGFNMALNEPLLINLYYVFNGNRVPAYTTTVLNNNAPNAPITHLDDWVLNTPVVTAGDTWAGQPIGIQFLAPANATGGYWDLDNVRLVAVPEPLGAAVFACVGLIAAGRRRR